jgi:hypothetical protein
LNCADGVRNTAIVCVCGQFIFGNYCTFKALKDFIMTGGAGGSILAMILSLKNNKAILPRRKSFKEIREIYNTSARNLPNLEKKSDPEFLNSLRIKLIRKRKKEITRRIVIIIISIFLSILLVLGGFWIFTYIEVPKYDNSLKYTNFRKEKYEAYKMFVYYGDYHFGHKAYSKAIYNYELALAVSPFKTRTKFNLTMIYSFACLDSSIYCKQAIDMLSEFIEESDTAVYALKLRSDIYMHLNEFEKADRDLNLLDRKQ